MTVQKIQEHQPSALPRFTAQGKYFKRNEAGEFTDLVRRIDKEAGDLVVIQRGDTPPPSRRDRARSNLGQGILAALGLLAALLSVGGAVNRYSAYQASKPDAETVAMHEALEQGGVVTTWHALTGTARAADETGVTAQLEAEFNTRFSAFLVDFTQVLAQQPAGLDVELARLLAESGDYSPAVQAGRLSTRFVDYMSRELTRQGVPFGQAQKVDLRRVNVLEWIAAEDALAHLGAEERARLADGLINKYFDVQMELRRNLSIGDHFNGLFRGAIGTGIAGVSLQELKHIRSKQDAQDVFARVVRHGRNFEQLNGQQKDALIRRASVWLDALDVSPAQTSWAVVALGLILAAAGLAGGALTVGRKSLLGLPGAYQEYRRAGTVPTLVIERADRSNPDAKRTLDALTGVIHARAGEIENLLRRGLEDNPELGALLKEQYGQDVPDKIDVLTQFIYTVRQEIIQGRPGDDQPTINELEFMERLAERLESGLRSGRILNVNLPGSLKRPEVSEHDPPLVKLRTGLRQVEWDIRQATRLLAERMLAVSQADVALKQAEQALAEAQDALLAASERHAQQSELTPLTRAAEAKESDQRVAQEHKQDMEDLLLEARLILSERLDQLDAFREKLARTIQRGEFNEAAQELIGMQQRGDALLNDAGLQELITQSGTGEVRRQDENVRQRQLGEVQARIAQQKEAKRAARKT